MEDKELVLTPVKELERNRKRNRNQFANTVNDSPPESPAELATEITVIESSRVNGSSEREEDVAIDSSPVILSRLESLPPKLLNRIICGVDFKDLKRLILVSKRISEAVIRAKECFMSPKKQFRVFRDAIGEFTELGFEEDEIAPNAPMRQNGTRRISKEQLSGVCRVLMFDEEEEEEEDEEEEEEEVEAPNAPIRRHAPQGRSERVLASVRRRLL